MINKKSKSEIKAMAKAGEIAAFALKQVLKELKPGMRTIELDKIAKRVIESRGAEGAFLGYNGYKHVICVSINDELVHGIPGSREIKTGDVVGIDLGVKYMGFCADMAKTVFIGSVSRDLKRLVTGVKEALSEAIKAARPGNTIGDIESITGQVLREFALTPITALSGHGIGRLVHEEPSIKSLGRAGTGPQLEIGMALAIEPMASLGTDRIKTGQDGWTITTRDASPTAHFEHTVVITDHGARILTQD